MTIVKLLYTNAQSIKYKLSLLKTHIVESSPHLIAITETWTNENIVDTELKIEGYEIVSRCDRKDTAEGRGGGLILVSSLVNVSAASVPTQFNQVLAVTISNTDAADLHIHLMYRSTNSSDVNNSHFLEYMSNPPIKCCSGG